MGNSSPMNGIEFLLDLSETYHEIGSPLLILRGPSGTDCDGALYDYIGARHHLLCVDGELLLAFILALAMGKKKGALDTLRWREGNRETYVRRCRLSLTNDEVCLLVVNLMRRIHGTTLTELTIDLTHLANRTYEFVAVSSGYERYAERRRKENLIDPGIGLERSREPMLPKFDFLKSLDFVRSLSLFEIRNDNSQTQCDSDSHVLAFKRGIEINAFECIALTESED